MKRSHTILTLTGVFLLGVITGTPALARNGHAHFGFYIGPGFYGAPYYRYPPYYYPPYYYPPYYYPPVVVAPAPQIYIEQSAAQPAPALSPGFWYYCAGAQAYYPYIRECSGGWQQVSPQPAN